MGFEGACLSNTATTSGTVVTGAGHYYGMVMVSETGITILTAKVYDNTAASGILLDAVTTTVTSTSARSNWSMPRVFSKGLHIAIGGTTGTVCSLSYAVR